MFVLILSKPYIIQGSIIINAITIGNNIVQHNDINWSNLIRGYEALIHININIITHDLKPKDILLYRPCSHLLFDKYLS